MYICPTCQREFLEEDKMAKHLSLCWKEIHPNHISKEAPRSENIINRQISNDIMSFFKEVNNGRNFN